MEQKLDLMETSMWGNSTRNWKYHGQGTFTWSDGDKYVGEYKDGKPWNGNMYNKNGIIYGIIVNGVGKSK